MSSKFANATVEFVAHLSERGVPPGELTSLMGVLRVTPDYEYFQKPEMKDKPFPICSSPGRDDKDWRKIMEGILDRSNQGHGESLVGLFGFKVQEMQEVVKQLEALKCKTPWPEIMISLALENEWPLGKAHRKGAETVMAGIGKESVIVYPCHPDCNGRNIWFGLDNKSFARYNKDSAYALVYPGVMSEQ